MNKSLKIVPLMVILSGCLFSDEETTYVHKAEFDSIRGTYTVVKFHGTSNGYYFSNTSVNATGQMTINQDGSLNQVWNINGKKNLLVNQISIITDSTWQLSGPNASTYTLSYHWSGDTLITYVDLQQIGQNTTETDYWIRTK